MRERTTMSDVVGDIKVFGLVFLYILWLCLAGDREELHLAELYD